MAGALVDHGEGPRTDPDGALLPREGAPGMLAALTNRVPPSPWPLELTSNAAPSRAAKLNLSCEEISRVAGVRVLETELASFVAGDAFVRDPDRAEANRWPPPR
jgi:hypothetical protein